MITQVTRTSRRFTFYIILGCVFILAFLILINDFQDKIKVLNDSNHQYQLMVDSQTDKLRNLEKLLKDEENLRLKNTNELKAEEKEIQTQYYRHEKEFKQEIKELQDQLKMLHHDYEKLQEEYEEANQLSIQNEHRIGQLSSENTRVSGEVNRLRQQLTSCSQSSESFKSQYLALFKQHQTSMDTIQDLEMERDRLKTQFEDVNSKFSKQKSSSLPQVNQPNVIIKSGFKAPTPKGVAQMNIEEPFVPNNRISSTSPKPAIVKNFANNVGAEPPHLEHDSLANNNLHVVHVNKEDVMEAPKIQTKEQFVNNFNDYFHQAVQQQPQLQIPQHQQQYAQLQRHNAQQFHPIDRPNANQFVQYQQIQQPELHRPVYNKKSKKSSRNNFRQMRGENLDQAVDGAIQINPGLRREAGLDLGEEDQDDYVDGQIQVIPKNGKLNNKAFASNNNIIQNVKRNKNSNHAFDQAAQQFLHYNL